LVTEDGAVTRKLGHKVRLGAGPREIACTSLYLDDGEWDLLRALPAKTLRKVRHMVNRGGVTAAIDELEDGTLLAEIDDQDGTPTAVPGWLDVLRDVTDDEKWTGRPACPIRTRRVTRPQPSADAQQAADVRLAPGGG
jgi:CYTH domain-containing protein